MQYLGNQTTFIVFPTLIISEQVFNKKEVYILKLFEVRHRRHLFYVNATRTLKTLFLKQ